MSIRLTPLETEDVEILPLGFQAAEDIARGNVYVDENGSPLPAREITERLRTMRGKVKIVRVGVNFWMPGDPKDGEPRERIVNVPVSGALGADDVARAVHEAVRRLYDHLRTHRQTKRKR